MGGGFDNDEFNAAYAVPNASSIPWCRPLHTKPGNEMVTKDAEGKQVHPPADVVAKKARGVMDEHVGVLKRREGAGEVWYY